jgi:hypothetical protein
VGASLTQVAVIQEAMRRGAKAIVATTGPPFGEAVAWALLVHFGATGFLAGYLFTALFLGGALSRAQQDAGRLDEDRAGVDEKMKLTASIRALTDPAKGKAALKQLLQDTAGLDTIERVREALQERVRNSRDPADTARVAQAFRDAGILEA